MYLYLMLNGEEPQESATLTTLETSVGPGVFSWSLEFYGR